jgi:hypothetical protein
MLRGLTSTAISVLREADLAYDSLAPLRVLIIIAGSSCLYALGYAGCNHRVYPGGKRQDPETRSKRRPAN